MRKNRTLASGRGASMRWGGLLAVAAMVGVLALISNITSIAQLSGEADTWLTIRFTLSKLVNSGTCWGGLLLLAGWLVRVPLHAPLAGAIAGEVALIVRYGLGRLLEIFGPGSWVDIYGPGVWADNLIWFAAALVLGPPLGLIGAVARRHGIGGLAARLIVPAAAVIEPLALGVFTRLEGSPAPERISSTVSGAVLLLAGSVGILIVLFRWRRQRDGERV